MVWVHKMNQLVQNDKIDASGGIFQQAKVEGDRLFLRAAAAPAAFHVAHGDGGMGNAEVLQQRQHPAAGLFEEGFTHFRAPLLKKPRPRSGVLRVAKR